MDKSSDQCRLCHHKSNYVFSGPLLNKTVKYFDCPNCGYLQTENPYWLEEAYASPINMTDTGIIDRNLLNTRRVGALAYLSGGKDLKILDFASGYGLLVRMLRDVGIEAYWADKYCENLFARGFEYKLDKADIITAFELFEHLLEPQKELKKMMKIAPVAMVSTLLITDPIPEPGNWWYFGEEHGQHIGFYRKKTMEYLARKNNSKLYSNGADLHIFIKKPYDIKFQYFNWVMRFWPIIKRYNFSSLTISDSEKIKVKNLPNSKNKEMKNESCF